MDNLTGNNKLVAENVALKNRICELEFLVKYYEEQFRLAKHRQFGASSEKSDIEQISLFNEVEVTADEKVAESELVEIEKHYRKRKRAAGDSLPENLPVETVEHTLPEDRQICSECDGALHVMGRQTRRELKIIPAQVKIVEHIQHIYSCRHCESSNDHTPIVKATMPEPVIKGSFASAEAVAHIMTQKFMMGLPLYRMEQEWNRQGIMLSRQTMSNWLTKCSEDWLEPIYDKLRGKLLKQDVLHADETTVQVLHEPGKTVQSNSYMWLYRTGGGADNPIILYEYQPDRRAERPQAFLKGYKGYLHTDGYDGYHKLSGDITVVGCWAHARRKFNEALKGLSKEHQKDSLAQIGMWYCDALFRLERKYAEYSAEKRYEARLKCSLPLAEDFLLWAKSVDALPKSLIGKALGYLTQQWIYLKNIYLDGRLELSNNRGERSIKPFVIGRKNWLFCNTTKGARASSVIYSIIETAKENSLKPFDYLVWLFKTMPNITTGKIDDLLPGSDKIPVSCRQPEFVS